MRVSIFFAALLAFSSGLHAKPDAPASEESILKLIEVTQSRKLLGDMQPQIRESINAGIAQSTDLSSLSAGQKEVLEDMQEEMIGLIIEDMSWERMEPDFIAIYRDAFTEAEVQGMLDFYATDAGQALIRKMPQVMQGSMQMVQQQMQRLAPKLQELQQRTTQRLRTCCKEAD